MSFCTEGERTLKLETIWWPKFCNPYWESLGSRQRTQNHVHTCAFTTASLWKCHTIFLSPTTVARTRPSAPICCSCISFGPEFEDHRSKAKTKISVLSWILRWSWRGWQIPQHRQRSLWHRQTYEIESRASLAAHDASWRGSNCVVSLTIS